jgi:transcriptional regulator of arginine metabolism
MKRNRQEKMLELISKYEIDTQDELIDRLRESGFEVTQATVSRDIRELKISKMTTGKGTYRYVLPKQSAMPSNMKFNSALIDALIGIDYACNLVVLKTHAGLANALAVGIDAMHLDDILGCVAGDDTILLVSRSEESARHIANRFRNMIK